MQGGKWVIVAALGVSGMNVACTSDRVSVRRSDDTPVAESDALVESHAVYDQRLQKLMAELQRATNEQWPEKMDDEHTPANAPAPDLAFEQGKPLADALARSAERIPGLVAHLVMIEADRRAFRAQSETLRDQAIALSTAVKMRDSRAMRTALHHIDATCRACHARFLDVSGPLSRL